MIGRADVTALQTRPSITLLQVLQRMPLAVEGEVAGFLRVSAIDDDCAGPFRD